MVRYYMIISGRVQGVGFRYFVLMAASSLGLTGWVRNCDNGNVEIQVQGDEDKLFKFSCKISKGNGFSVAEKTSVKSIDLVPNEKKFDIKYY
ncbi:MAG: acylphosphatase [Clostridiaceae bacterium]